MVLKFADEKYKIIEPWCFKFRFDMIPDQYLEWNFKMVKRNIIYMYKKHPSMKVYFCFYCGDYGEQKDHVPAISYAGIFEDHERILVRSCITCNSVLSNKPFHTIQSRCEFLLSYFLKKHRKLLSSPVWTQEEIDELKGSLKSKIITRFFKIKNHYYDEKQKIY